MKTKLHISLLFMLCMTMVAVTTRPALARPTSRVLGGQVDAYIQETMKRLPIPGLAVGIVKGDRVLYMQGYGTANVDGDLVTPQTPFMLASVTKTFTALAVQQLANAGKIDLVGWILIPHPWAMTFKEFYVDYQPWITLIYLVIFFSPIVASKLKT